MLNARQRNAADDCAHSLLLMFDLARTDPEAAHGQADELLLRLLTALGTPQTDDVVNAYRHLEELAPWWAAS